METLLLSDKTDSTLILLYKDYGLRTKEIGELFGVTESAIQFRLKKLGIPTNPREVLRKNVIITSTLLQSRKNELDKQTLQKLFDSGRTKADIARTYKMSEAGVSYRMSILGVQAPEKAAPKVDTLKQFSSDVLERDYLMLTSEQFSSKYQCSKVVWAPYLKELGISLKTARVPAPLTQPQKTLVLGSLLGDGSVSTGKTFYEFHCTKQKEYLLKKWKILESLALEVRPSDDKSGYRFSTRVHPYFQEIYPLFYKEGVDGKHIPVSYLRDNWDDSMLAIWFLDDGYYDVDSDSVLISNKCPDYKQLQDMVSFLEETYRFSFRLIRNLNINHITFSKLYHKEFFEIVGKFATSDMLYKFPEEYLDKSRVEELSIDSPMFIKYPSLYRTLTDDTSKKEIVLKLSEDLRKEGFPYELRTMDRLTHLLKEFVRALPSFGTKAVMTKNGTNILEHFFTSRYSANRKGFPSPKASWDTDEFVRQVAQTLLDTAPTIRKKDILRAVRRLCRGTVTVQSPSLSSFVYQRYNTNGNVLDTSGGYGPRMLSAMSHGLNYHAYEPNTETYSQLNNMGNWLSRLLPNSSFHVWCSGSEDKMHKSGYYGLAFTSPPYFDYEEYSSQDSQSIVSHTLLVDWLDNYWSKVIRNTALGLTSDGFFVVNLSPRTGANIILHTEKEADRLNLGLQEVVRVSYGGKHNGLLREEWLLVFRKGYPKKITTLPEDLTNFLITNRKKPGKERVVAKEANRERSKAGGIDREKIRVELVQFASNGGNYSRENLKVLWEKGGYPLSEPTWVIESDFGKWSDFLLFCGLSVNYEVVPLKTQAEDYLKECLRHKKYLSHYAYNALKADLAHPNKYSSRVKRFMVKVPDLKDRALALVKGKIAYPQAVESLVEALNKDPG